MIIENPALTGTMHDILPCLVNLHDVLNIQDKKYLSNSRREETSAFRRKIKFVEAALGKNVIGRRDFWTRGFSSLRSPSTLEFHYLNHFNEFKTIYSFIAILILRQINTGFNNLKYTVDSYC